MVTEPLETQVDEAPDLAEGDVGDTFDELFADGALDGLPDLDGIDTDDAEAAAPAEEPEATEEGEEAEDDAPGLPDVINPQGWDGTFPNGPAPVVGEQVPYLEYIFRNVQNVDGISQIPPEHLSLAIETYGQIVGQNAYNAAREQYESQLAQQNDALILSEGESLKQQGALQFEEWASENPERFEAYLQARNRAGSPPQQGLASQQAPQQVDATFQSDMQRIYARIPNLPKAAQDRVNEALTAGTLRGRPGLNRLEAMIDREYAGQRAARARSAQKRRQTRTPAAAGNGRTPAAQQAQPQPIPTQPLPAVDTGADFTAELGGWIEEHVPQE